MTTMVANATRVAAVAEDATRLLGLRSPGQRAADVTATKRRHAHLAAGKTGVPVRSQVLSAAIDPGSGVGGPLVALLDQPGFVTPALLGGSSPSADDVAVADLPPPPTYTPGPPIFFVGGRPPETSSGGPPATSSGGPPETSSGGPPATSSGGPPATSSGGPPETSSGGPPATTSSGGPIPPAVPEPSTWLMMLAGFAAIGTAMRRAVKRSPARGA